MEGHHDITRQGTQQQRLPIILSRMPQQIEILGQHEDWTGKTSPAARRKLQNRLHQRSYSKQIVLVSEQDTSQRLTPLRSLGKRQAANKSPSQTASSSPCKHQDAAGVSLTLSSPEAPCESSALWRVFNAAAGRILFESPEREQAVAISTASFNSPPKDLVSELKRWASSNGNCRMGLPRCSLSPAADQLLVLEKFNVFRALLSNSSVLGFATEANMKDDALSPFLAQPLRDLTLLPMSLHPTALQCYVPHHPWIDLLPDPRMRDNILCAGDDFDEMALCGDLVGLFSESSGQAGMVVWGHPWMQCEWEVTEDFLRRWAWVVEGCGELLESTNRWRMRSGERRLRF